MNFTEAVYVETGNILIKKVSDNSTVETIDVSSSIVEGSGTNQITLNPETDFVADAVKYYIQIPSTAFKDKAGNSYKGINDKTSLSFVTVDNIKPTLSSSWPSSERGVDLNSNNEEAVDVEEILLRRHPIIQR